MRARSFSLIVLLASSAAVDFACGESEVEPGRPVPVEAGLEAGETSADAPSSSPYGLDARVPNTSCKAPARPPPRGAVAFVEPFAGTPLYPSSMLAQIPGDKSRVFISGLHGEVVAFSKTTPPTAAPPIVISTPKPVNGDGEGGFYGFAFHPKFAQNGYVYFTYVAHSATSPADMQSIVARMKSTDNGNTFGDYTELIAFDQPERNHKGGGIAFGPDGFLYLTFGDGGGGDDTFKNGQTLTGFFSKVLRIDVDSSPAPGRAYAIPDGNPFKNGGGEPAAYAYGFRNPWRLSIDKPTGDLWLGDVGQESYEEVDRITAPGGNYGWPCREGAHDHILTLDLCPNGTAGLVDPVHDYERGVSGSVTGGAVYRGSAIPSLVGTYVYGDFVQGQIWGLDFDPVTGAPRNTQLNATGPFGSWLGFSADDDGELYALDASAKIWKLVPAGPPVASTFPERLSQTGCFDAKDPKMPVTSLVPFGVNAELWSDGATKQRWISLPDGARITVGADGDFDLPNGSIAFKTFALGGRPVETRMLVRHDDGAWAGYSYEWNNEGTDATLLPAGKTTAAWTFPSRGECIACHTKSAGGTLGLELAQLNRELDYPSTNRRANQLTTFEHIELLDRPLAGAASTLPALPDPLGTGALDARARAYLHANCSMCHRPGVGTAGALDLRAATGIGATGACDVAPSAGALGIAGAKILAPGDPSKSVLLQRMRSTMRTRMPPLATKKIDTAGSTVVEQWISGLKCPAK